MILRVYHPPPRCVLPPLRSQLCLSAHQIGRSFLSPSQIHTKMGSAPPSAAFTPLGETPLFKPFDLGTLQLKHRIVQVMKPYPPKEYLSK